MIAALADFQVRVVRRRQLDPFAGHEVDERIVRLWHMRRTADMTSDVACGPARCEHFGCARVADESRRGPSRRGGGSDDDLAAVFGQRPPIASSDSSTAASMKPQVLTTTKSGTRVRRRDRVALGTQLREDLLGVDERLRTPQRYESDARGGVALYAGLLHFFTVMRAALRAATISGEFHGCCSAVDRASASCRLPDYPAAWRRTPETGRRKTCRASGPASAAACP